MPLLALCWNSLPKAYLTQPAAMPHVHISTLQGPKLAEDCHLSFAYMMLSLCVVPSSDCSVVP